MTVLGVLIAASCIWWWLASLRALRARLKVPRLDTVGIPARAAWPRVSLIVPACNEVASLDQAVSSRLSDDYPDLEVVLVEDRSTDGTAAVVDALAARDARVIPIHVSQLPGGWLGKVHALHQGVQRATGEWLLFSDADVAFSPGTLRRAVAFAEGRGVDHVVALPRVRPAGFVVDAVIDTFLAGLVAFIDLGSVQNPRSRAAIGGGVFSMVRRAALERTRGLEWLRLEVADDVALGQMLKRSGARQALVNASGLISLEWYPSVAEMARGMEKNLFAVAGRYRLGPLVLSCGVLLWLGLGPLVALGLGVPWWMRLGCAATLAAGLVARIEFARWTARRVGPGLLFPVGLALLVWMALRAGLIAVRRGGITWRGTLYPLKELRQNIRLELF